MKEVGLIDLKRYPKKKKKRSSKLKSKEENWIGSFFFLIFSSFSLVSGDGRLMESTKYESQGGTVMSCNVC